jgi:DNA-binding CsgD family transcriptional regulator
MSERARLQSALGAIERAFDAKTQAELDDILGAEFARFGFQQFQAGRIVDAKGNLAAMRYFGRSQAAWRDHYMARQYFRHDSMLRHAMRSPLSKRWKIVRETKDLSRPEFELFGEAGEFGLRDGIVTPLHHGDGSISGVGVHAEQEPDLSELDQAVVQLLSMYYCCFGLRLNQTAPGPQVQLTARQIECLQWVHAGKSSGEIADITGISERTVNFHIGEACRRLKVRTRRQAVVEALVAGLIDL